MREQIQTPKTYNHREVISTELATSLGIQAAPNARFDNFLHESVQLGNKTTVRPRRPLVAGHYVGHVPSC